MKYILTKLSEDNNDYSVEPYEISTTHIQPMVHFNHNVLLDQLKTMKVNEQYIFDVK